MHVTTEDQGLGFAGNAYVWGYLAARATTATRPGGEEKGP